MKFYWFFLIIQVAVAYQQYCRCECDGSVKVAEIDKCGLCTSSFCLEQVECKEKDSDIIISCFQIESLKETILVYLFMTAVLAMLGFAVYNIYWLGS